MEKMHKKRTHGFVLNVPAVIAFCGLRLSWAMLWAIAVW
jgi:hypothetical protein